MSVRQHERQAIARVEKKGVLEGTAFLVANKYAITARHVVRDIADRRVDLVFSDPEAKLCATVVHPPKEELKQPPDWALLELDTETPRRPLRLQRSWQENAWVSYGFGHFYVEGKPLPPGGLSGKVLAGLELQCDQLDNKDATDGKGFSGAPVIVSCAVIGVIAVSRKNTKTKKIKCVNAVDVAQILADWPERPAPPDERPAVLIAALTSALKGRIPPGLATKLELSGYFTDADIAERLAELSYAAAKAALQPFELGGDTKIARLLDALWIHPNAGAQLHKTLKSEHPVAAIRTASCTTVRHHLMRAHGIDHDGDMVTWGDPPHMIRLVPDGQALDVLIEEGAIANYKRPRDTALKRLNDPYFGPAIFTIPEVPSDDDILAAKALCPNDGPRIVAYKADMSIQHLQANRLTATLIEPFPDAEMEKQVMDEIDERENK